MKFKRAFTLIELLLVIAIVAIIFAFSAPYTLRFYNTQLINETQSNILSVLSQARHNALLQKNDSDWGVKFDSENNQYILFQGSSYAENVDLYDEVYPLLNNVELTGDWTDEIVFSKYTGVPTVNGETTFGTTTLAYESMTRQIFIDEDGLISNVVSEVSGGDTDEAAIVADLRVGLVGYWPLDDTSETTASDESGNNNDGTLNGGVLVNQTGKVGQAMSFDGSDDYISLEGDPFTNSSAVSFSVWVNVNNPYGQIITCGFGSGMPNFSIGYGMFGPLDFFFGHEGSDNMVSPGTENRWYLLTTVTTVGGQNKFYVDGLLVGENSYSGDLQEFAGGTWRIGNIIEWGQSTGGLIDEVAVWNRPLEPEEIAQLCNDTGSGCVGRSLVQ